MTGERFMLYVEEREGLTLLGRSEKASEEMTVDLREDFCLADHGGQLRQSLHCDRIKGQDLECLDL